ncbi:MAG: hypothetical protein ABI370_10255 [Gammaproteobacteria bacterium]
MFKNIGILSTTLALAFCAASSFAISPGAGQAQIQNNMQNMQQNKQQMQQMQQNQPSNQVNTQQKKHKIARCPASH